MATTSKVSTSDKAEILKKKRTGKTTFNQYWIVGAGIVINHIIAFWSLIYYRHVGWQFIVAMIVAGFFNLLGITAGYHRLWSHHAYKPSKPLAYFLASLGAMAWQGSIHWWVIRHRMHHRFVDTKYDPYDSTRGLWFSHFGWLFERPRFYEKSSIINMSDIINDPVCRWNRYYTPHLVIALGMVLPLVLGAMMGDAMAGFIYIGVWGRIISWNGIFAVNSFSHHESVGGKTYAMHSSATSSLLLAVLSNGEGNHNYHHEFPHDYRHGVLWGDYDPTKWFLWMCNILGLASNLITVEDHVRVESMKKTKIQEAQRLLDMKISSYARHMGDKKGGLPTPKPPTMLPTIRARDITSPTAATLSISKDGSSPNKSPVFLIIDEYLVDVTLFQKVHPGSETLIRSMKGKDATEAFWRGRNMHTQAANNIVKRLRVARVTGELESKQD